MFENDISKHAKNTLREIRLIEMKSKKEKLGIEEKFIEYTVSLNPRDTEQLIFALRELNEKKYINIDASMDACEKMISFVNKLKITRLGRKYIKRYMIYEGALELNYREEPNNLDYKFRKLKEHGVYIILIAAIPVICGIIDTIINIINNSN